MTKTRFSHAACQHPSTKAGRAACRKALRAAAAPQTESASKPATAAAAKKDPTKKAASETPAPVETAPAAEPVEINSDTWREHKDKAASVYINGVAEPFAAQCITGWSIKFLQFTDSEGKRQRIPASTVERVTV